MTKDRSTGRAIGQVVGAVGVVASLVFVAYEIRQNTMAARAAAIQEIGIATADMWADISRDPLSRRNLSFRSDYSASEMTVDDWVFSFARTVAWARLAETGFLQVQEGLLPASSLDYLGYDGTDEWRLDPAIYCLWKHRLKYMVGEEFAARVESGPPPVEVDCEAFPAFPFRGFGRNGTQMPGVP